MRRNRLLLPWGLLAGLLIWFAAVEGLNIKPPSLRSKTRNAPTTPKATPLTTTTTSTTTTTTEAPETTTELEHENETLSDGNTTKSLLSGIPQIDYVYDPNLPRELPKGYNLSDYPFFERVPDDVEYDCEGKLDGFYANVEYKCQIYHHCVTGLRYDFLCPNYTAFDQRTFNCHFVSEVDCVNSAKWWFRNEPLYKGRKTTTTTTTTTTALPTTSTRRPSGGGGRRRRPYRRRRPQYDYYDEEDYEDEYEDELEAPGQTGDRQRKRQRQPTPGTIAAADADLEEKPLKPIGASVYRPRVLPRIRRPVPINERDKYDYKKQDGEKRPAENADKPSAAPAEVSDKESEKPKRPADSPAPVEKTRAHKPRPPAEDEYYDDEDYDVPVRTSSRKNHQDYYAPSGGDRDFTRRPAMSGAGRPLRRNRPGRRRPAVLEYDDDYEDVRRPYRPSAPALDDRRRPTKSRKRPYQRDDYYDDEEEYDRPSYRDTKRPQSSRDVYDRPSPARDSIYDRASPSRESAPRSSSRNTPAYERPAPSSVDSSYDRPATPTRDSTYERPAAPARDTTSTRDSTYERPAAPARDTTSTRDSTYERQPPARDSRPLANTRDAGHERSPVPSREADYNRAPPPPTARDVDYDRDLPPDKPEYSRTSTASKKRVQTVPRDSTYERPRQERPSLRGSTDYERTLPTRPRPSEPEDQPIPAARPAYISTTGRTSSYRKRGPEEPVTTSGLRGIPRPPPKVTEPPPLDDEEYYDDEEEELEEELPQRPTGSGRTQTGSYRDTPVESRKPTGSRDEAEELKNSAARIKGEGGDKALDERDRTRVSAKERERVAQAPPTGRGRLSPSLDDVRSRIRPSYTDEDNSETRSDGRVSGGKTLTSHEQTKSDTNRATESILEQPPLRATQGNQQTKEESPEDSAPQQRQGFRPAEVTTDRYSNFRRKPASGGTTETKKLLPPREDRVVEIAEDVHIAPSSQGRGQTTGEVHEDNRGQVDVELEGETSREEPLKQLDTSKFISSSESEEKKSVPLSGPSAPGFNHRSPQKSEEDEAIPTGRGASNSPDLLDDTPHRNELPDINDPEYDVTLNEALQPTRPILLSTEGAVGKKKSSLGYPYHDVSLQPDKIQQTLLTSASQTHVSKAPLPHRPTPQYDDYDDPPIPTGKGGTTPVYSTTESAFRGSSIALSSRGAFGQQFPGSKGSSTQYVQFPTSPATGTLRQLEQELSKTLPRSRVNPLPYRSPAQGTIREADFYRGTIDPIALSLGYDYDQATKYRPRRKLVWRNRFHDFYNLY